MQLLDFLTDTIHRFGEFLQRPVASGQHRVDDHDWR
jgi:hypothetical protein